MSPKFYNYPQPREGPAVPYVNETQSIPVFRGRLLEVGATIIHSFGFVQNHFWRNAGFDVINDIEQLKQYEPRYDPAVAPILEDGRTPPRELPAPTTRRGDGTAYYTSADYHARYRSGELTPTAVIEALLPLIRRGEDGKPEGPHAVAFLESQEDQIRAAAEASTQRYKDGKPLGPLDGVPVAVKDEVHLKGYKRTLGSKLDFRPAVDETSWCIRKWEEAGAIVIGKTNMHELGLDTTNNNPNYGTPRNPHNVEYYSGGSSGGSAYAVAAGLVPIAHGADGGGSIRIPSSFTGLWGLKPTHGRVSGSPTVGLAPTVGVHGPMAASIDDLALAYRIMAAPAPAAEDPISALFPDPLAAISDPSSPRPKIIGLVRPWIDRAEPPVRAIFDAALDYYRTQAGYSVVDIDIPYLPEGQRAHVLTIMSENASSVKPDDIRRLTAPNKVLVSLGANQIGAKDLITAQRLRQLLMTHLAHLFQKHPGLVIFTPTTPMAGWKIEGGHADLSHGVSDGKASVRNMEYAWLANFTGCPAINCPGGYLTESGVPVGLTALGEWGSEEALIAFARDGEGVLHADVAVSNGGAKAADPMVTAVSKGLRTPGGKGAQWVDVIAEAGKLAQARS
ncbi:hypothetical protein VTN02DRAFT_1784 [Thermoascus thermophilus]